MCIIVYKPGNKEFPSDEIMNRCAMQHPDGGGYMYPTVDKTVCIHKGFASWKDMKKNLFAIKSIEQAEVIMHFRTATHGTRDARCTHPFPITDSYFTMHELHLDCDIGVAHNGVFSQWIEAQDKTASDTMVFIKKVLFRIKDHLAEDQDIPWVLSLLGLNKLAIMWANQNVRLLGAFMEENGCYFSNSSFKQTVVYYPARTSCYVRYSAHSSDDGPCGNSNRLSLVTKMEADALWRQSIEEGEEENWACLRCAWDCTTLPARMAPCTKCERSVLSNSFIAKTCTTCKSFDLQRAVCTDKRELELHGVGGPDGCAQASYPKPHYAPNYKVLWKIREQKVEKSAKRARKNAEEVKKAQDAVIDKVKKVLNNHVAAQELQQQLPTPPPATQEGGTAV